MVMQRVTKDGVLSIYGDAPTMTDSEVAAELARRRMLPQPFLPAPGQPLVIRPEPPPPPPRPDPAALRAELRAAHEARANAKLAAAKAAEAVDRATALVDEAQRNLDAMAGIDGEVARYHADSIRGGLAIIEVPASLAARLKAKVEAETKLEQLGAAKAQLAAEAEQARANLANAEGAVSAAAAAVLVSAAEEIADAFDKAKAEADSLTEKLRGMAAIWSNGAPLQLSPRLRDTIAQAGGPRHDERWSRFMAALREDPEATFAPA